MYSKERQKIWRNKFNKNILWSNSKGGRDGERREEKANRLTGRWDRHKRKRNRKSDRGREST